MAGMLGNAFCVMMVGIGLGVAAWNVETVGDGVELLNSETTAEARITGKRIEKPHSSRPVRMQSISVNGVEVRSIETYYRDHFFEVRYAGASGNVEALAPVGFDRFRADEVGEAIVVTVLPDGGPYVDAEPRGTLLYALKRILIGALIAVVGLAALLLPEND
ncbi:MAG: hypothetical protein AAFU72_03085 [Pseudomonadota bacterium]